MVQNIIEFRMLTNTFKYFSDLGANFWTPDDKSQRPQGSHHRKKFKGREVVSVFGSTQLSDEEEFSESDSELSEEEQEPAKKFSFKDELRKSSKLSLRYSTQIAENSGMKKSRSKTFAPTFSKQDLLPRLPVPDLNKTLDKYLQSVEACTLGKQNREEILAKTRKAVEEFRETGIAEKLQNLLIQRNQSQCPSWLEKMWDDAYLCGRDSIALNVNYYFVLKDDPVPEKNHQIHRAASLISGIATFKLLMDNEELDPDMERDTPLDMSQHHRMFGAARIPHEGRDKIIHYTKWRPAGMSSLSRTVDQYVTCSPRHIVVIYRNQYYSFNILTEKMQILTYPQVKATLEKIVEEAHERGDEETKPVGDLTILNRDEWAEARQKMIDISEKNLENLEVIQSALFLLCLDNSTPEDTDELSRLIFHGPCQNRFFDKHQLIVAANGKAGFNFEHSVGDGTTTLRMAHEVYRYSVECNMNEESGKPASISFLKWQLNEELDKVVHNAYNNFKEDILATETRTLVFRQFGGLFIKDSNLSPDATIQVAMQLAYYILYREYAPTYEAASTKKFLHGRTETVRSLNADVVKFCQLVLDKPLLGNKNQNELWEALKKAVNTHVQTMRLSKEGQGIDRHLYGLSIMFKEHFPNETSPQIFTDPMYRFSSRWVLSTSHCGSSSLQFFGFGPVVNDGYGIGYMIKNDEIDFNITSKFSSNVSSRVFAHALEKALITIQSIIYSKEEALQNHPNSLSFTHPTNSAEVLFYQPEIRKSNEEQKSEKTE